MKIGFIGLGNMGAPMARNLVSAGHEVVGFDTAAVAVEGVEIVASAAEAAAGRDAVFTMLPSGSILRSVYEEIVPAGRPGAIFVDSSTVDVESARAAAARAEAAGIGALDAPVSGGVGGAAAGTLTFMVGGSEESFAIAKPLFEVMCAKAVLCGGAGAGQTAKICNNMILGTTMVAVCEGFALAAKLGLDSAALYDVVSTSSGQCWAVNTYCPVPGVGPKSPADNDYQPGFAIELMLKDMNLSQDAAGLADASTPLAERATELYGRYLKDGGQGTDFSGIFPWIQGRSNAAD